MITDFIPTPFQTGRAIGRAVNQLADRLSGGLQNEWLSDALVSEERYRAEILLISAAAALHSIESSGLSPSVESEVAAGLFAWAKSIGAVSSEILVRELDEATDYYAEAAFMDKESCPPVSEISEIEAALADRLLALGENNQKRGEACIRLCLIVPKVLWPAQFETARTMLAQAALLDNQ